MHAWEAHTHTETNWRECTYTQSQRRDLSHTHTVLSKQWLLGRAPLWFWLPVKGKQHELLWPKKCNPDQSHMCLALHLYHVSALALRGLEKFRSALREMQERTSRAAGVRRWMKNRLIFMVELTSAFFKKSTWQIWVSHVFNLKALLKSLSSPDARVRDEEKWKYLRGKATGQTFHHLPVSSTSESSLKSPENPSPQQPTCYRLKQISTQEGLRNTVDLRSPLRHVWMLKGTLRSSLMRLREKARPSHFWFQERWGEDAV